MQPEQLLESFKKDLENLKDNDKYKINALTIFARDHKDTEKIAHGVVELTTRHVHMIPSGLKLLGLYVIDSIVKNVGAPYRKLYTTSIVDAFVHSFQAIRDEKGRLKLYSLRTTWKDIFPNSRMYELDIRVREHDPAWPLLATPPESKAAFRALPNIPKIQTKHEAKEETNIAEQPPPTSLKATISTSRDPRLNRKRKSSNDAVASPDEFLIDRSGDQKMEAVARKQGKQEEAKVQSKKVPLFGGQDLDMRSQAPVPSTPAARSCVWSSYIDKHAEVGSRREVKDVDMRLAFNPTNDAERVSESVAPTADTPSQPPLNKLPSATSVPVPAIPDRTAPDVQVPASPTPVPLPSFGGLNVPNEVGRVFNATTELPSHRCVPAPLPPIPSHEFHPRISPPLVFEGDARPLLPPQPPMHRPPRGPPIRGPVWSVEINGFPDMVNIGVDPRMLSLVSHPKPPRRITIDGKRYSLLLDRVQPLIMVGDQVHAVRFRCDFATVLIDGRCFNIPGTGFTKVTVGWRPYQAYLGGPGHELVVDGRPHTIPIGSQLTFINVGYHSVGVKFVGNPPRNVNVLPPIPPRLLKWAGQGLFGSPRSLHLAPLNPLVELARLAEGRPPSYGRSSMSQSNQAECGRRFGPSLGAVGTKQPNEKTSPAANSQNANAESSNGNTVASGEPVSQPIDVHELFKKLVKAGIVTAADNSQAVPPPELVSYSWERFKLECPVEVDALYTGHQCGQCGLRFQSDLSPEFASHLDYHYMKNSSEDHDHRSRNFYQAARYWLLSEMTREGAPQFEPGTPVPDLQESKCAAFADPAKNVCAVCYEKFDVFWDHDEEEWMLRDAVLVGDKAYHPICQEDAGKEFPAEEHMDDTKEEEEVKPPVITVKTELAVASPPVSNADNSPEDENAFMCADPSECTQIPGLSPVPVVHSPDQEDPQEETEKPSLQPIKMEPCSNTPVGEQISADPLAALKAVLRGDVSSFIQSHPSS
ncbi:unnamed protein product [Calicophoron daubneyi]|uniref:CID domain-containing protein n=1 Tax=Calicophoron daubneyi TaxID=300641 RepID=A0AAV2TQM8_CALDB